MSAPVIHTDCEQGSGDWFELRRGIPTASEFHRIMTPTGRPSGAATGYLAELIAESVLGFTDEQIEAQGQDVSYWAARGHEVEPEARAAYAFHTGLEAREVAFITRDGMGCSPDALAGDDGGCEIKCPAPKKHMLNWLTINSTGDLPNDHRLQVNGSLIVSGRDWWDFVSYCPGLPMVVHRVTWTDFTTDLAKALSEFTATQAQVLQTVRKQLNIEQEAA